MEIPKTRPIPQMYKCNYPTCHILTRTEYCVTHHKKINERVNCEFLYKDGTKCPHRVIITEENKNSTKICSSHKNSNNLCSYVGKKPCLKPCRLNKDGGPPVCGLHTEKALLQRREINKRYKAKKLKITKKNLLAH